MLPVNLLNQLKQYAIAQRTTPLPVAAADPAQKAGPQFDLGQKLQGSVQAQVAPNVFKVNVSGQLVQMQLPPSVRSGDTVALQVISLQPRLTFSMVNSDNPLSTPEQLGATARMLSSMSQQAPDKAYVRAAQSAPLWEAPHPPESAQLAGKLQEALGNSGLFYESHQAQWLGGERSTSQLMLEPQNLTPEQARAVVAESVSPKAAMADQAVNTVMMGDAADKAATANDSANPRIISGGVADANTASQLNTSSLPEGKALGIPEHLQPLVQQQLNALETRQMLWQGHVWPGQEMQWEVHEQAQQASGVPGQRQWVTQIQLELPNLGAVSATLRLNSAGLSLTLNAATPQTRAVLGNASTRLVSALSEAGIPVLSTQVSSEAQGAQP